MPYKVYNELPGVEMAAKTLKSVICYNMYKMMIHGARCAA